MFTIDIAIINGNPYVTPPEKVLAAIFQQAGKDKGTIPIRGKLNGTDFKQTLVRYEGDWRLYLNGVMLRNAGIKFRDGEIHKVVGTPVKIDVEFDPESREIPMHPKLAAALRQDKKAQAAFDELPPYRKHEINRYLSFAKTEATVDKNIVQILLHLRGEKADSLYPLMHRKPEK